MIRWITPQLGTGPATSPEIPPDAVVIDVRNLVDKPGNRPETVAMTIAAGVDAIRSGARVVVCCDYGVSRSNAVAAGILARAADVSLNDAARRVAVMTEEREIKLGPFEAVRRALGDVTLATPGASGGPLLVTGGLGFVGTALVRALGDGATVAPSRDQADVAAGALALDLVAKERRVRAVVHLANPRMYTSTRAIGEMIVMLRNVLDVCRSNDLPLVFLSSWEVFSGYRSADLAADEALPLFPKGPYGEGKALAERLIEMHTRMFGLRTTIVRSSPVYGVGGDRPKFIWSFLDKAARGETIRTHRYINGLPALDLLYIDDLVAALAAIVSGTAPPTVHLGGGGLISTRSVAERIIERTSASSELVLEDVEENIGNIRMDHTLATRELGWRPSVSFDEGLGRILPRSGG